MNYLQNKYNVFAVLKT